VDETKAPQVGEINQQRALSATRKADVETVRKGMARTGILPNPCDRHGCGCQETMRIHSEALEALDRLGKE
jgi:hypothetical protein